MDGNLADDDPPPLLEREEPLTEDATPPASEPKNDILTTRDSHDEISMQDKETDTTMGEAEDVEPQEISVNTVKKEVKKGRIDRRKRSANFDKEDESQREKEMDIVETEEPSDEIESETEQMEEKDHQHENRPASIEAKRKVKQIAKREWKKDPKDRKPIPKNMKFTALRYFIDKKYGVENTAKLKHMCGVWWDDLVVGHELETIFSDGKTYKAKIAGFAPNLKAINKVINEHFWKSRDEEWNAFCKGMQRRNRTNNKINPYRTTGLESSNESDNEDEKMDEMPEKTVRNSRKKETAKAKKEQTAARTKRSNVVPKGRKHLQERKSESSVEFEHSDNERNEVEEPPRKKKKTIKGRRLNNQNSPAKSVETITLDDEAEANDGMEEHGYMMDTGDEPMMDNLSDSGRGTNDTRSGLLNPAKVDQEMKKAQLEKRKAEKEKEKEQLREQNARKEEQKREEREKKIQEKHQLELESARDREDEERIVMDGIGGDVAMPPPTSIRIPKKNSQNSKDDTVAVKQEPAEETEKKEEPTAPKATIPKKNTVFDQEKESVEAKMSAVVQKKDDLTVTKKDKGDIVAKTMSTDKKTAEKTMNLDEGVPKMRDDMGSRLITVKKEPFDASAMPRKGILKIKREESASSEKEKMDPAMVMIDPPLVVLSSDDEDQSAIMTKKNDFLEKRKQRMKDEQARSFFENDPRLHGMSHARYIGAAAKELDGMQSSTVLPYCTVGSRPPVSSFPQAAYGHPLPVGASSASRPPSSFALSRGPTHTLPTTNSLSSRTSVGVSVNPYPVGSHDYARYEWQRGTAMQPVQPVQHTTTVGITTPPPSSTMQSGDIQRSMQYGRRPSGGASSSGPSAPAMQAQREQSSRSARADVPSSSSTDYSLMQLQQNVMPSENQPTSSRDWENLTMPDDYDYSMDPWKE